MGLCYIYIYTPWIHWLWIQPCRIWNAMRPERQKTVRERERERELCQAQRGVNKPGSAPCIRCWWSWSDAHSSIRGRYCSLSASLPQTRCSLSDRPATHKEHNIISGLVSVKLSRTSNLCSCCTFSCDDNLGRSYSHCPGQSRDRFLQLNITHPELLACLLELVLRYVATPIFVEVWESRN